MSLEIDVSVITSYTSKSLGDTLRELSNHGIESVDLYCFNDKTILELLDIDCRGRSTISDLIAEMNVDEVGEKICELRDQTGVVIKALATFLPHICSHSPNQRDTTIKAISRLLKLARVVGCNYVELLVGGTLSRSRGGNILRRKLDKKTEYLLDALATLSSEAHNNGVCMLLEAEPGPNYILNSPDRIASTMDAIYADERINHSHVGINLDIGHMLIQRSSDSDLNQYSDAIGHMHISDNASSHFADLPPLYFHSREEFAKWLELPSEHTNGNTNGRPGFSQTVAVELEACEDIELVELAYYRTKYLLRR